MYKSKKSCINQTTLMIKLHRLGHIKISRLQINHITSIVTSANFRSNLTYYLHLPPVLVYNNNTWILLLCRFRLLISYPL